MKMKETIAVHDDTRGIHELVEELDNLEDKYRCIGYEIKALKIDLVHRLIQDGAGDCFTPNMARIRKLYR